MYTRQLLAPPAVALSKTVKTLLMNFFKTFFASLLGFFVGAALLLLIVIAWAIGVAASAVETKTPVPSSAVLRLDLDGPIAERTVDDPLSRFNPDPLGGSANTTGLNDILYAIREAKTDKRIKGIYITTEFFGGGMSAAESIHNALVDFKSSGKFIYAYGEILTERAYFVAAPADSIFLFTDGYMEWNGIASTPYFIRGLLDKLGVEPMVFKVGTFKSATEMFSERQMSPAAREQTTVLLQDLWQHMLGKIATARKREVRELDALASSFAVQSAKSAVAAKLVDAVSYEDEVEARINARMGREPYKRLVTISATKYAAALRNDDTGSPNVVAVVYGEGEIGSGTAPEGTIGSETLAEALRKARLDKDVKAIVFRVNSPGGSAMASEVIRRELILAKKEKPVIASYGDVAASGGYWISANADAIVAQPTTITGSIGIFGMWFNTQKLFAEKVGVNWDRVTTNAFADIGNPNRPMTEIERRKIQGSINEGYGDFIRLVKDARKFSDSLSVDKIAQGRVWSGLRARQIGLVDTLGGIDVAVAIAAEKAGLGGEYELREYPKVKSALQKLTEDLTGTVKQLSERYTLTPEQRLYLRLRRLIGDPKHHYALSIDYDIR